MKALRRLLKWMLSAAAGVLLVFATLLFARAFAARRLPPLKPWHHALSAEVTARDITDAWTLDDYLRREDAVFRQMNETVLPAAAPEDRTPSNRYWPDSPINPEKFPKNWNRTFELLPEGEIRGGALLIHGLTDSPYSVKAEAELLRSLGYYALCLRMPGHGTVPGALTEANWEDWRAAVRLGVRHVRQRVGAKVPLVLGGILQRRRALGPVRPRRARPAAPAEARPDPPLLADDRRVAVRRPGADRGGDRGDPLLRAVALDGRPARVHPVQVRLVPRARGHADGRADRRDRDRRAARVEDSAASRTSRRSWRSSRSWTRPSRRRRRSTASSRSFPRTAASSCSST